MNTQLNPSTFPDFEAEHNLVSLSKAPFFCTNCSHSLKFHPAMLEDVIEQVRELACTDISFRASLLSNPVLSVSNFLYDLSHGRVELPKAYSILAHENNHLNTHLVIPSNIAASKMSEGPNGKDLYAQVLINAASDENLARELMEAPQRTLTREFTRIMGYNYSAGSFSPLKIHRDTDLVKNIVIYPIKSHN